MTLNLLTSLVGLAALLSYLLLYTPLKRRSRLCTLVGAFPGAAPVLMGWTAVRGDLAPEAWVLYAILFLWQFPHFLAIGWMYREDYARAGMLMIPDGRWERQDDLCLMRAHGPGTGRGELLPDGDGDGGEGVPVLGSSARPGALICRQSRRSRTIGGGGQAPASRDDDLSPAAVPLPGICRTDPVAGWPK